MVHAAIFLASLAASGGPPALHLHGDAKCFSIDELERELEAAIGATWITLDAEVTVSAVHVQRGWQVAVEVRSLSARAERNLHTPTCALALRSIVLVVALALEDLRLDAAPSREPALAPVASIAPIAAATSTRSSSRSPRRVVIPPAHFDDEAPNRAAAVDVFLRAALLMRWGVLPGAAPGVALSGGVRSDGYQALVRVGYTFSRRVSARELEGAGGDFDYVDVHLALCARTAGELADAAGCLAAEAGVMRARGFGVENPRTPSRPWAGAGAAGSLRFPLGTRLAMVFEGEILAAIRRPSFEIGYIGALHTPPLLAGTAGAAFEISW